jgi:predicted dehydrogenase
MQNPIRIGAVGLGGFGQFVMAAFKGTPEVQVTAVYDVDANRAAQIATQYGVAPDPSHQSEVTLDQTLASLKLAIDATAGAVRR